MRTLLPARWLVLALAACNAPPGQPQIAINPGQPDTLADLQVLFLADTPDDNEKDLVAHSFQWFEDGSLRTDLTTDTVPAAETDKGETWRVVVTPNDGDVDGEVAEAEVTILDAPPSLTLTLEPQAPYTDDDLVALATGDDADGDDVTFRYAWTRDGAPQELDAFTVPAALTAHGETWEVTVTPVADDLEGEPVSLAVVIGNTPPTLDAVQLTPEAPTVADVLQAIPSLPDDLDGDNVTLTYDWTVNGALVQSGPSDLLDATSFRKHDQVQVTATPDDGLALGAPVQSDLVEVQNALPTAADVTVSPNPLREGDVATCSPSGFADLDGDPEGWRFTWTVDGVVVGDQQTLDSAAFQKGQSVVCAVQPDDGESLGVTLDSAPVQVINTPPVLTSVDLSTLAPTENDTLTATLGPASDADGDAITYGYAWFVNGTSVSFATSLPSSRFQKGDEIFLLVTAFDGEELSTPVASATAVAVNTPPALTAVSITPADLFTNTVAVATPAVTDLDGDNVTYTYDWYVDGFPRGSALSPSLAGGSFFDKDQSVYVVVTPFDGEDYGQALQSPVEIVLNTPPTAPVVEITPADPQPGDTLTCAVTTVSTDADGDAISYAFDWDVNGVAFANAMDMSTSSAVEGGFVHQDDTWTCDTTASDGDDTALASHVVQIAPSCSPALDLGTGTSTIALGATTAWSSSRTATFWTYQYGTNTQGGAYFNDEVTGVICPSWAIASSDQIWAYWHSSTGCGGANRHPSGIVTSLLSSEWTHVAVVVRGATSDWYVNGVLTSSYTGSTVTPYARNRVMSMGSTGGYAGGYLKATIDDLAWWNRSLSDIEVAAVYAGGPGAVSSADLIGWWPMDEGSGSTFADVSGNGATGSVGGNAWTTRCVGP